MDWFSLAQNADERFYFSHISRFDEALSEEEFVKEPMLFKEMAPNLRVEVQGKYHRFFDLYLSNTSLIDRVDNQWVFLDEFDRDAELDNFLWERKLNTFIDAKHKIIFQAEPYLEFNLYSKEEFTIDRQIELFQRTKNVWVEWSETDWF